MNEHNSQPNESASQRPRNPRVPVQFSLQIQGTDANGNPFETKAEAIKISRGGATIALDMDIDVGSVVKLVPSFGGKLEAEVNGAWLDELDGSRRIGVRLLHSDGWFGE